MKRNLFSELKEGLDALKAARESSGSVETNPHMGSSFDDFLAEEGSLDEATEAAKKRITQIKHK